VLEIDDARGCLFYRHVCGQRENLLTRRHDLADGYVVELKGAMDEGFLKTRQDACAAGGGGNELELFGRMSAGALGELDIEAAEGDTGGTAEEAHGGTHYSHEEEHGRRNGDGEGLRAAQSERFGNEFAENDVEVSDEAEAQDDGCDGYGVRIDQRMCERVREPVDNGKNNLRGKGLAEPAESQGAEGDAELNGGEKVVEIVLETANGAGAGHAGVQHLLYACVTDGDQCELGGDKETIGQDQHANRDALEEKETVHHGVRIAFLRLKYGLVRLGTKASRAAYGIARPERKFVVL